MKSNRSDIYPFVLGAIGLGIGAIVAKLAGANSWPEAKLYLVVGCAIGILAHHLFKR